MGYHIDLHCKAILRAEFIPYLETRDYLWMDHWVDMTDEESDAYEEEHGRRVYMKPNPAIPVPFQPFHEVWCRDYDQSTRGFRDYTVDPETGTWQFTYWGRWGDLSRDVLEAFMTQFVVPMTHWIEYCKIEEDFYDTTYWYTDEELRHPYVSNEQRLQRRVKDLEDQLEVAHGRIRVLERREHMTASANTAFSLQLPPLTSTQQPSADPPRPSAP